MRDKNETDSGRAERLDYEDWRRRGCMAPALLLIALAVATAPLWILLAPVYCLCTGRTLKGCGEEANRLSGFND